MVIRDPFIQYAFARIQSLINRDSDMNLQLEIDLKLVDKEKEILKHRNLYKREAKKETSFLDG